MAGIAQDLVRVIDLPRSAGSHVLPDRFKISQLMAGLSWAPHRATSELHRRHASGPAPMAAETRVNSPLRPPAESAAGYPARNTRNKGRARSANFGVLAAVQLHKVGVVPALWLGDVGVLAAVQPHDAEAAPGEQLAQVPHPVHARERDSYSGGEDRAAEQREPCACRKPVPLGHMRDSSPSA